jgi:hypothetical protein
MRKLLTALLVIASVSSAQAKEALWSQDTYWKITGFTDTKGCVAVASYNHGSEQLLVGLRGKEWSMSFVSANAVPMVAGTQKTANMIFSGGESFYMPGKAIDAQQWMTIGVYSNVIALLGVSDYVTIQNFQSYPLTGSYKAIIGLMECAKALSGEGA